MNVSDVMTACATNTGMDFVLNLWRNGNQRRKGDGGCEVREFHHQLGFRELRRHDR